MSYGDNDFSTSDVTAVKKFYEEFREGLAQIPAFFSPAAEILLASRPMKSLPPFFHHTREEGKAP